MRAFDALVQRAGVSTGFGVPSRGKSSSIPPSRAARRSTISPPASSTPHGTLLRSPRPTEGDLIRISWSKPIPASLSEKPLRDIQARAPAAKRLAGVLDNPRPDEEGLKTRLESYPQVSVVPEAFFEKVKELTHPSGGSTS